MDSHPVVLPAAMKLLGDWDAPAPPGDPPVSGPAEEPRPAPVPV